MPRYLSMDVDDDPELSRVLSDLPATRAIAQSSVPEVFEDYLRRRAHVQSVHGSVSIEGNPLDLATVQFASLEQGSTDVHRREASNTDRAYQLMRRLAAEPSLTIDSGVLRLFNFTVLDGMPGPTAARAGQWRSGGAMIIDTSTRRFVYTGPPSEWVPDLIDGMLAELPRWLAEDPIEVAAAKAHFALVSIHPFGDGNGRTARILADLLLAQASCDVRGMIALSSVIHGRRGDYYAALQDSQGPTFRDHVNITSFVRFHTLALETAMLALASSGLALQHRQLALTTEFGDLLNVRRIIGMHAMFEQGPISTPLYAHLAGCPQPTAFADLTMLREAGLVARIGTGKATRYELSERAWRVVLSAEPIPD